MQLLSNQGVSCRNIGHEQLRLTQSCGNSSTAPTLVPICREIRHVAFTRFLVPISVAEGPHLVPIALKMRSPFGPHFEKFRSLFHVGAVHVLYLLKGKRKVNVEPLSSFLGLSPQVREEAG